MNGDESKMQSGIIMTTTKNGIDVAIREEYDWTTRARTGFCIAGAAASPKKPILQRERRFSDVTDTPKNVTASGNAGKCWKPQTGSRSTGRKWNG